MTDPRTDKRPAGTGRLQSNEAGGFGANPTRTVAATQGGVSAQPLLDRLDRVRRSGKGWMARCPAHDDKTASLSITEAPDKVLLWCFAGCRTEDVLAAVGLAFRDLFPPRHWPDSPEQRRAYRRQQRETAYLAALGLLPLEAKVVQLAARKLLAGEALDWDDFARLVQASTVIESAADALIEARHEWPMSREEVEYQAARAAARRASA